MGLRKELKRKIEKKNDEVEKLRARRSEHLEKCRELLTQILEGKSYIQALQEALKLVPREDPSEAALELRKGSALSAARDAILAAGKPLHINDLLAALGKALDHGSRSALSGSLAAYVRNNEVFTRPAPNTFGLIELEQPGQSPTLEEAVPGEEPPADFGAINGKPEEVEE